MSPISKVLCLYLSRNVSFNTNLKFTRTYYFSLWSRGPCPSTLLCLSHASLVGKGQLTHSASSISRISFHPQLHFNFYFNFQFSIFIFNCHFQFSIARVNSPTQDLLSVASLSTLKCIFNPIWWLMCVDILRCSSLFGGVIKNLFYGQTDSKVWSPPPFGHLFEAWL